MQISKSKIKTLESCPLCFLWQYIEKRKPDIPPAAITQTGINVHDIFNKFYDNIKLEEIPAEPFEYFKNCMTVLPQYKGIYDLFCTFQARRWKYTQDKEEFMPLLKEKKFINADETGIVDVVHVANKEYVVMDYKSSVLNPTNLRFELNYYAKMVNDSNMLDKPVKYICVYGYKDGGLFYEPVSIKSYNLMLKKVDEFRQNDWENMQYPKKIGYACNWCSYITSCNKIDPQIKIPDVIEE